MRWMEYLSRFDFDITYVKGVSNKVADALSRYYESDTPEDQHHLAEFVNADIRIDKLGEDIPLGRKEEAEEMVIHLRAMETRRESARLKEKRETRELEAEEMENAWEPEESEPVQLPKVNPTVIDSRDKGKSLRTTMDSDPAFVSDIKSSYATDPIFSKVLKAPNDHPRFFVEEGLIWTENAYKPGEKLLCIPKTPKGLHSLRGAVIEQAQEVVGHFGPQRMADYICHWYWWPKLYGTCEFFCRTCETCNKSKGNYRALSGKLHSLPIPTRPWQSIGMDFIGPFPEVKGYNYLWVVICRLTSQVHLIPIHTSNTATDLSAIYFREIVRLHGLPESIVSDRDPKFTSVWWKELHRLLGAKLLMSTSFHPQTDGATERANHSIGQIFHTAICPDQRDWLIKVPIVEFALNSSMNASTCFAPFELVGGYMPSMMREVRYDKLVPPGIHAFAIQAMQNLYDAHDALIASRVFQTHEANKHRSPELDIKEGSKVYLSTKNLNLPKARATKLLPKFVGPYTVLMADHKTSTYELDLPEELIKRRIHPRFHVSLLRPYIESDSVLFPDRKKPEPYDFGAPDDAEEFVECIEGHEWKNNSLFFYVRWALGDLTIEPYSKCKALKALDEYLAVAGISDPKNLPKLSAKDSRPRKRRQTRNAIMNETRAIKIAE
ncbi:uncharacterized protein ARMOST_21755 [Armillaria ostoyae]|uniref:Integrase catalytic domain-containing protein n=1 Tax=Armillaria ostoyae TaxID=47428 RepID=A0A284SB00_ARMOS|nr:uncharacterized protein ARMOST_21755 [Armillaria ostoyae]